MAVRIVVALATLALQAATVLGAAHGGAGTVTFLHTNDNHAHIEPMNKYGSDCAREDWEGCFGGYARMKVRVVRSRPSFPSAAAAAALVQAQQ